MRIYMAARYSRRLELLAYAKELRAAGHEVTSRWLNGTHEAADNDTSRWGDFAKDDLEDIRRSDVIVLFTETALVPRNSRMVELGIALGLAKRIIIVGPRENVFCCLPDVLVYRSWEDFNSVWVLHSD